MRIKNLFLYALISIPLTANSQTKTFKNEFGFRSDNDSYLAYGQDRYYTNGLFITYRSSFNQNKIKNKKLNKLIWEIEGGQKMYNAQSGSIKDINLVDRPFAAYLYAGAAFNFLYNSENNLKISIEAGTIGKSAKGKEAQELLHKAIGFYEINGWEWQVKNETGINTSLEYNYLLDRSKSDKTDFTLNSNVTLGNTFAGLGAGITFRAGTINKLFNSASSQSRISNAAGTQTGVEKEFFFYAKPMLQYIAYDATIQGGLFRNDKGPVVYDIKSLVFSQQAGLMYAKNRWTVDFSVLFKSREVKSKARPHQYGSVALYYKFN